MCGQFHGHCDVFAGTDPTVTGSSTDVTISSPNHNETTLSCSARGCPTPRIEWTGPDGHVIGSTTHAQNGLAVVSTIEVLKGGNYHCVAHNGRLHNGTKQISVLCNTPFINCLRYQYNFLGHPKIVRSLINKTVNHCLNATLTCSASGFPLPSITWISPSGSSSLSKTEISAGELGVAASSVYVTNEKGADSGGIFTCTASNAIGNDAATHAMVSGTS